MHSLRGRLILSHTLPVLLIMPLIGFAPLDLPGNHTQPSFTHRRFWSKQMMGIQ